MAKVNGFQTGDKAVILNVGGIMHGDHFFNNGDVVEVKVQPAEVLGVQLGDRVYLVPTKGDLSLLGEDGGLVILGEEFEAIAKVEGGGKIGNHDDITISRTFDDGKLHEHTPNFKKGERVLTLPGASISTFGTVEDGEVYEITEVQYAGDGDFMYRMGHGRTNFVAEDEIIRVTSDHIGNHSEEIEIGDIVRALPGASIGTNSVVAGEVYVVTLIESFMGETFYDLGTDGGNSVYRAEIELIMKGAK